MARLNTAATSAHLPKTHEGAIASRLTPLQELRRTVCACLLWENTFYESGQSIADRIAALVPQCAHNDVAALAIEARTTMKLRHVPLLLVRELLRTGVNVAGLLPEIIRRPDELTEFLALYWQGGKTPIAASVKRGLARAFQSFSAYSLAKYNRDDAIKLRDVLFLVHAKPKDAEQAATWKALVDGTLAAPDTWEVALSAGADKAATFTRLIAENKLGALALLRNLRGMTEAGVTDAVIRDALTTANPEWVLPFRFISAAKHAPRFEPELEQLMFRCLAERPKLKGRTALLVDGSGSMFGQKISAKSDLERFDAAAALAMLVREVCEDPRVSVFSTIPRPVPPRRGFALRDVMFAVAEQGGTATQTAKLAADAQGYDRIIIFTDEQSAQTISAPLDGATGYVVNIASYKNGIGYGRWNHIDGFSEAVLDFIQASEADAA